MAKKAKKQQAKTKSSLLDLVRGSLVIDSSL
jgi:hypothetical protein